MNTMVRNVSTLRSSRGTYNPLITIIASLPMMVVGLSVPLGYVLTFLYFLFFDIIDKSITFAQKIYAKLFSLGKMRNLFALA